MLLYVYFIDPSEVKPIEDIFYPHAFKDPSQISFNITYKYKISPVLMTMMKKENKFFFSQTSINVSIGTVQIVSTSTIVGVKLVSQVSNAIQV